MACTLHDQGGARVASDQREIQNEALRLYEFGIEDQFRRQGRVAVDSSLGMLPEPSPGPARDGAPKH